MYTATIRLYTLVTNLRCFRESTFECVDKLVPIGVIQNLCETRQVAYGLASCTIASIFTYTQCTLNKHLHRIEKTESQLGTFSAKKRYLIETRNVEES